MTRDGRIHALLPWFLNGTLPEPENQAFADHLSACEGCQKEMKVVRKLQRQMEKHGEAFVEDHPSAEEIVAASRGELSGEHAERVSRHLALCRTCALEDKWARGKAVAGREAGGTVAEFTRKAPAASPATVRMGAPWWLVAAALVAGVVFTFLLKPVSESQKPDLGLNISVLVGTELSDDPSDALVPDMDAGVVQLLLSIDAAPSDYPLTVEVESDSGDVYRFERSIGGIEQLIQGQFVLVPAPLEVCSPGGSCTVRARTAGGSVAVERAFRVAPASD
ncbi:hypothetical protein ABI59_22695 [Acidobacteria bacterium Mor1]|nr:hypothetical protein ABI59_22695 [Acidobacteria bacterium Mor1]